VSDALPDGAVGKSARVAESVRAMIHDGRLREGDALPSTRALAAELGVARGTVVTAFEQLDGEGYITTRHGAAARVAATLERRPAAHGGAVRPGAGAAAADAAAGASAPELDLTPGTPSVTALSARDWRGAWRHVAAQPLDDAYPPREGEPALRAEIAKQLAFSRGFAPEAERVVIAAGTAEALSLIAEALGPGIRIAIENPGYLGGRTALASAGARLVPIGLDRHGMLLEELRAAHEAAALAAVLVTPSHQYPLGAVMPVARRRELLEWAALEGVLVIEDDYDSEFRHHGSPLPALAAIDTAGVVVHVGSFSKPLNPQLRCGYLVLPGAGGGAEAAIRRARTARGAAVATPMQQAIAWLMATGALRRHLGRARRDYAHKRAMVADAFAAVPGVGVSALDGGLHAVVQWAGERGEAEVLAGIRRRGVVVAGLSAYVVPGSGLEVRGLVLGYGAVSATQLARALEAIVAELG